MRELIGSKIIYDTSSLIELFQGTKVGKKVEEYFTSEKIQNLIPNLVLAELTSKFIRIGENPKKYIDTLEKNCIILNLNSEIAKMAGSIHADLKKKEPKISLIDCIIIAHGYFEGEIRIITTDKHFKNYKNSIVI